MKWQVLYDIKYEKTSPGFNSWYILFFALFVFCIIFPKLLVSFNIGKIYVGPIQVVDRQSTWSTSIHSRVLPIQFRALGMALRVPWSIPELCHWIFEHPDLFRSFLLDRRAPVSIPEFLIGSDLNLPYPNYF